MGQCNQIKLQINPPPYRCICGGHITVLDTTCLCGYPLVRCANCKLIWAADHKLDYDTFRYSYEIDLKLTKMVLVSDTTKNSLQIARQTETYNKSAEGMTPDQIKDEIKTMEKDIK